MSFFLPHVIVNFVVSVAIGVAISPIISSMPLLNDDFAIGPPPSYVSISLMMGSVYLLGFLGGWFNQTEDHDLKVKRCTWSAIAICVGTALGIIWVIWPFTSDNLYYQVAQVTTGSGGATLFSSLLHIAGHDASQNWWNKRQSQP